MGNYEHTVKTVCRFCRREFESFGLGKICADCDAGLENQFQQIKAYINENPSASMGEICQELDVPIALVKYYLKEERLEIRKGSGNMFLRCVNCNTPIASGRYCKSCETASIRDEMKSAYMAEERQMNLEVAKFRRRLGKPTID